MKYQYPLIEQQRTEKLNVFIYLKQKSFIWIEIQAIRKAKDFFKKSIKHLILSDKSKEEQYDEYGYESVEDS